jgi:hypothetical protein
VTVTGDLKEGGTLNFSAQNLKPTHPTKPLAIAQTLFNALGKEGTYEVELILRFGYSGRTGLEAQLRALSESADDDIKLRATFEKPLGGGQ